MVGQWAGMLHFRPVISKYMLLWGIGVWMVLSSSILAFGERLPIASAQTATESLPTSSLEVVLPGQRFLVEQRPTETVRSGQLQLSITLQTPHPGWQVQLWRVLDLPDEIVVVCRLGHRRDMAAFVQTLSTTHDAVTLPFDHHNKPVYYYIYNKFWSWDADTYPFSYRFQPRSQSPDAFLAHGRLIYEAAPRDDLDFQLAWLFQNTP